VVSAATNIPGAILGDPVPLLGELHFNGDYSNVAGAPVGTLIIDDNTSVLFDQVDDFLFVDSGKDGQIKLSPGSEIIFSKHERKTNSAVGGAISMGSGGSLRIHSSVAGAGDVRFENNAVNAPGASGGAIGAAAGVGQRAWVFIDNVHSITFKENFAHGGGLGSNLGGAISASGNGNGTWAQVSLIAHGAVEFTRNAAAGSGGAIAAFLNGNNSASANGVSVTVGADSILFDGNFNGTQAGGFVGSGRGGAIFASTGGGGSSSRDLPALVQLISTGVITSGDIILRNNKASAGAAIFLENWSKANGQSRGTGVRILAGRDVIISNNETRSGSDVSAAVDILGGGGYSHPAFSAMGMSRVLICDNLGGAIKLGVRTEPMSGWQADGLAALVEAYGSIELSRNISAGNATGAAMFVASEPDYSVNALVRVQADRAWDGNISIRENVSTASAFTDPYRSAVRGGGAISAIAGNFEQDSGLDEASVDFTVATGSAGVEILAGKDLDVSGNSLALTKGSGWTPGRSDKFIGGGAIFVFSTDDSAGKPLFDLFAGGDFTLSQNKATGDANPHGGVISAASVKNEADPNIWPNAPTTPIPIPADGRLASGGVMKIMDNEAAGKGGAIYLHAETGDATLEIAPGLGGGLISRNKAGTGAGASASTGGAFHIKGATGASLTLDARAIGSGNMFTIRDNVVGTSGTRAIYLESGATGTRSAGSLILATSAGGTIALHDGITAVTAAGNTAGYDVLINPVSGAYGDSTPGTFAQIGANAEVFIPGQTTVSGGTHSLSAGARYQTFAPNASPGGSYKLESGAVLAVSGTGNILASASHAFAADSTLRFDLGTNFTPGNTNALLILQGGNLPSTSAGNALPGANKIDVTGALAVGGDYYLVNATNLGRNSVAQSGLLTTSGLTLNGNAVTPVNATTPPGGRDYIVAELRNTNPANPDTDSNKLFLHVSKIFGNIENTWTGAAGNLWKSSSSGQNAANWDGQILTDSGNTVPTNLFLQGDLVRFDKTATGPRDVTVDSSGVIVGRMDVDGADFTFSGGKITGTTDNSAFHPGNENRLRPKTDGSLHISNGGNVTIKNTIEFKGDKNAPGTYGVQITGAGSKLILADGGRLGPNDAQEIHVSNGGTLVIDRKKDYDYKGVVHGNGGLTKSDSGKLTLRKDQDYTGIFSVTGGTVVLQGINQQASGGSLAAGATLAGDGNVTASGDFTVSGTLSPGGRAGEIGKLSFGASGGNVTLAPGAKLIVDLLGHSGADLIAANGNITINGADISVGRITGRIKKGDEYVVVAAIGGTIIGTGFNQSKVTLNGNEFDVVKRAMANGGGEEIVLITTHAVPLLPEPSTYALCGGLGALALAVYRRRRRASKQTAWK
jgi:autotransporter-associated beta strand protein